MSITVAKIQLTLEQCIGVVDRIVGGPKSRPVSEPASFPIQPLGKWWKDRTGVRQGRLVFLKPVGKRHRMCAWLCQCDCGKTKTIVGNRVQSCGCLQKERSRQAGRARRRRATRCEHSDRLARARGKCSTCYQIELRGEKDHEERNLHYRDRKNRLGAEAVSIEETKRRLQCRYKLTPEQRQEMVVNCRGMCICGTVFSPGRRTTAYLDHDHRCCPGLRSCGKCIRGLLCNRCNRVLGLLKENPQLLPAYMLEYLEKYEVRRASLS